MAIPLSYNVRNLRLRKGLTIMTALGIALTVATAIFIMALLAGLNRAFGTTGDPLNVLVLRKGSYFRTFRRRRLARRHANLEGIARSREEQQRRAAGIR